MEKLHFDGFTGFYKEAASDRADHVWNDLARFNFDAMTIWSQMNDHKPPDGEYAVILENFLRAMAFESDYTASELGSVFFAKVNDPKEFPRAPFARQMMCDSEWRRNFLQNDGWIVLLKIIERIKKWMENDSDSDHYEPRFLVKLSECLLENDAIDEETRGMILVLLDFIQSRFGDKTVWNMLKKERSFIVDVLSRQSTMKSPETADRFFQLLSQTSVDPKDSLLDSSQNLWPAVKDALKCIFKKYATNEDGTMCHSDMRRYCIY